MTTETRVLHLERRRPRGPQARPWLLLEHDGEIYRADAAGGGREYSAADLAALQRTHRLCIVNLDHTEGNCDN